MTRTIIIVVLALLGIFVHPFAPGTLDFIYRFIIFASLTYLIYLNFKITDEDKAVSDSEDIVTTSGERKDLEVANDTEWHLAELLVNDSGTEQYLERLLDVISNMLVAENAWILVKINSYKVQAATHKHMTDSKLTPAPTQFTLSGLLQLLDSSEKIILENKLNREQQLLEFYANSDYKPSSFLGIPVNIDKQGKLFFIFDAATPDHFNHDDIIILEKLKQNAYVFLSNRLKAFSLLKKVKTGEYLLKFASQLNGNKTISAAIETLSEHIANEFEATRMTICIKKGVENTATIRKVLGQQDEFGEGFEFKLDQGLTGWVIEKNKPYLIEDLEKGEYFIPRYTKEEKTNHGLRSFLGMPFEANGKVYGSLTLEHNVPQKYTEKDKEHLQKIISIFSTTYLRQQS